ncbi:LLM class flavin-dependent oxidoreductase [Halieaceae bacterium IMCC14734]|uniref:LLM class flavin-dependent oxidoreductase n=2 Tax=Candidatus Litorirhabdus singularis TaxID=2518993 RepID=A0ABT3TM20_9GAMM|nr:LLM class flavin-dependent oxidoreductase [Candidatus Litorirhabdus singularis]
MYILRFDMRAPTDDRVAIMQRYKAANAMVKWGESNGCVTAMISEHHAAWDNYLPSPLLLATSFAANTQALPISIGVVLLNFYDPIKLAEDMAVLDILSEGRVSYIIGLGYRQEEYDMFGVNMADRGQIIEEKIALLLQGLSGESFEHEGRKIQITPKPQSLPGITIAYGGHTKVAARRAGKFGFGFFANGGTPELLDVFNEASINAGHEPGAAAVPEPGSAQCVFVAEDMDKAWANIGPHMLHDIKMYREWEGEDRTAVTSFATTVDQIREQNAAYRILSPQQALDMIEQSGPLMMHPLVGGCPPELGWETLQLVADKVLPELSA